MASSWAVMTKGTSRHLCTIAEGTPAAKPAVSLHSRAMIAVIDGVGTETRWTCLRRVHAMHRPSVDGPTGHMRPSMVRQTGAEPPTASIPSGRMEQ
jgi:hypothetical protein